MLRRSTTDQNHKCPALNGAPAAASKSRKTSKKRYSKALLSSTLFSFCAVSAILCLAIQTRFYDNRIPYDFKLYLSTVGTPVSRDDDRMNKNRKQLNLKKAKRDGLASANLVSGSDSLRRGAHEEERRERLFRDMSQKAALQPRIVHYDNLPADSGELKHLGAVVKDEPAKEKERSIPEELPVDVEQAEKRATDKVPFNVSLDVDDSDPDDEEQDSALEDKNAIQGMIDESQTSDECVPLAKWHSLIPVNCNSLHEIDLLSSIINSDKPSEKHHQGKALLGHSNITSQLYHELSRHPTLNESQLKFLGQGWFRAAWKLDRQPPGNRSTTNDNDRGETVILKMLRPERDFTTEFYELHRIDAVAMEQLTHSKFVLDVYGYCGQSALNEFASFRIPELSSLEKFDRRLRGKDHPRVNRLKLKLAISVATGVAHIHELPSDLVGDDRPAMAHYDLNPRNVAVVKGGIPKLNDFNVAHFLRYDPSTNLTCGFESRLHEPWWRAPEEVSLNATGKLTHAVDVWSLGNLLFHILTTHSPRGKMKDYRIETVRGEVLKGTPPDLPKEYLKSTDPVVKAFRKAMQLCFIKDPSARAEARDVADVLFQSYLQIAEAEKEEENKK